MIPIEILETHKKGDSMKLHWMNHWMIWHTAVFWALVFASLFKIEGLLEAEWGTLFQLWIWNLFAYLYVAFMNFLRIKKNENDKRESVVPVLKEHGNELSQNKRIECLAYNEVKVAC